MKFKSSKNSNSFEETFEVYLFPLDAPRFETLHGTWNFVSELVFTTLRWCESELPSIIGSDGHDIIILEPQHPYKLFQMKCESALFS